MSKVGKLRDRCGVPRVEDGVGRLEQSWGLSDLPERCGWLAKGLLLGSL